MFIKTEFLRITGESLICMRLNSDYLNKYDSCVISLQNIRNIAAATEGYVKDNSIYIDKFFKYLEIYIEPDKEDIVVLINYYKEKTICHEEHLSVRIKTIKDEEKYHSPIVFTGNKGQKLFNERIKQKLLTDWEAELTLRDNELLIRIRGEKRSLFLCLGLLERNVQPCDLCFNVDSDIDEFIVPGELVESRFLNKKIALHLLAKPDFQKKIKNLYYKSKISNEIEIIKKDTSYRRLDDYATPTNGSFNPLEWIINYNTQLPEYID